MWKPTAMVSKCYDKEKISECQKISKASQNQSDYCFSQTKINYCTVFITPNMRGVYSLTKKSICKTESVNRVQFLGMIVCVHITLSWMCEHILLRHFKNIAFMKEIKIHFYLIFENSIWFYFIHVTKTYMPNNQIF